MIVEVNMNELKIKRINELYHKEKTSGLSEVEKAEQALLRKEYIEAVRKNLRGQLDNIDIKNPDGTITELKRKRHEN